jgi:sulfur-carrier protein
MSANCVTVKFAASLQRHVPCPDQQVAATTLAEALGAAFVAAPALRHYVLDDQGAIRKHVAVFINSMMLSKRDDLTRALSSGDRIDVAQALSGG